MRRIVGYIVNLYFRMRFFRQVLWSGMLFLAAIMALLLIFRSGRVTTEPVGWEKSFAVSSYRLVAQDAQIAERGNYLAAVFEGEDRGRKGVYISLSLDGGNNFINSIKVASTAARISTNPHAAISSSGLLTVMWHDYVEEESTNRIFFSTSSDLGATWTVPQKLFLGYDTEMLPKIYYDDRNILHLFYHGSEENIFNLFHAVSKDGKEFKTTGSLIRLTRDMRGAFFPAIHFSGKYIFIVWQGKEADFSDELFFIKSSNYGRSWSSKRQITSSRGNNASPAIAMSGGVLYLVYQNNDDRNWAIILNKSLDEGGYWDERPMTISSTSANCYSPSIVVTDEDVLITWHDVREKKPMVYSRKYSIRDRKLMPEAKLSVGNNSAQNSSVISVGSRFIVFWEERNYILAKFSDIHVDPPAIFSETNPPERWSRLPFARLRWRPPADESGIAGYATIVNKIPAFNPTVQNIGAGVNQTTLPDVDDGITYFHIRAIDGAGNYSRTVHYKLLVSANPLPSPVVVSSTHPQGQSVDSNAPVFSWSVGETERLKGFLYSISRDVIKSPEKFISDFKIEFSDLTEGNYFFRVAAIDKTNQVSPITTYNFTIGRAELIDPDYLKRIAEDESEYKRRYIITGAPYLAINFPFDRRKPYGSDAFKALITARNVRPENVMGYSVYVDSVKRELPERINMKGNIIDARELKDGDYFVGVRCKYRSEDGRILWSKPYTAKITVQIVRERSPMEQYALNIMDKFARKAGFVLLTFFGLTLIITRIGFGSRIAFYLKLLSFRGGMLFRTKNRQG